MNIRSARGSIHAGINAIGDGRSAHERRLSAAPTAQLTSSGDPARARDRCVPADGLYDHLRDGVRERRWDSVPDLSVPGTDGAAKCHPQREALESRRLLDSNTPEVLWHALKRLSAGHQTTVVRDNPGLLIHLKLTLVNDRRRVATH